MNKIVKVLIAVVVVIGIAVAVLFTSFRIENITVEGCVVSEESLIIEAIKENSVMDNSLLLYLKWKFGANYNVPFVAKLELDITDRNNVHVKVYEKSVAGCFAYMDSYIFFDKDGIVLEAGSRLAPGIPWIDGLVFDEWKKGQVIPVSDESKFNDILAVTQLMEKYELSIEGITFTPENEIVLHYKDIDIEMGEGDYLAIQMMNLGSILEKLDGQKGTLYMKDYDSEDATASFKSK